MDVKVSKELNDANSQLLCVITCKSPHSESSTDTRTFDLLHWIRARRLECLGHILRMGTEKT